MKTTIKIIAYILSVLMLVTSLPISVFAQTTQDKLPRSTPEGEPVENIDEKPTDSAISLPSDNLTPVYDNLGRTMNHTVNMTQSTASLFYSKQRYTYETGPYTYISGQISKVESWIGKDESSAAKTTLNYTYDQNGNITKITDGSGVIQYQYEYDDLGQLVREDNRPLGYSYTYSYDNAGNILSKKTYAFTTGTLGSATSTRTYTYGDSTWGDLLTNYWGDEIAYDNIGNPILIGTYDSDYDIWYSGYELKWDGRQLVSYRNFMEDGGMYYSNPITFQYNANGIRTSKTVDGVEHKYYLNGSQILAETWTQNGVEHLLIFVYDENGSPIGLKYRTSSYAENTFDLFFFEKNLQGDIVAIYNTSGTKIGSYTYDAWGLCTTTVASGTSSLEGSIVRTYNPFRYRGYYYDVESSLYYLQSRYYNPHWGRFINADGYISTGTGMLGYNMFAYCNNNPILRLDPDGFCAKAWKVGYQGPCPGQGQPGCMDNWEQFNMESTVHLYDGTTETPVEGKLNVAFYPSENDSNSNPQFIVYDSWKIKNKQEQQAILEYIMSSDYYSQDMYCRTLESLLVEWDAHNDVYFWTKHSRVKDTNFDRNDEGTSYWGFWWRAIREGLNI